MKVYVFAPIKTEVADLSNDVAGAEAAASAINARGGLGGHEVQIVTCNETDANSEAECAREAADGGALATANSIFVYNPAPGVKELNKAKIPDVATYATQAVQFGSQVSFPIDAPTLTIFGCAPLTAKATGGTRVAVIGQDLPSQAELVPEVEAITKGAGLDFVGSVKVPVTEQDYSSAVSDLMSKKPDVVVAVLAPTGVPGFYAAQKALGAKFATCGVPSSLNVEVLKEAGATETYSVSGLPSPYDKSIPLIKQFNEELEAEYEAGNDAATLSKINPFDTLRSWLGLHIIEEAAGKTKGELTRASLLATLNKSKFKIGSLNLNFAKPPPIEGLERLFNPAVKLFKFDPNSGQWEEVPGISGTVTEYLAETK